VTVLVFAPKPDPHGAAPADSKSHAETAHA
jgi:hypothetical protein